MSVLRYICVYIYVYTPTITCILHTTVYINTEQPRRKSLKWQQVEILDNFIFALYVIDFLDSCNDELLFSFKNLESTCHLKEEEAGFMKVHFKGRTFKLFYTTSSRSHHDVIFVAYLMQADRSTLLNSYNPTFKMDQS